VEFLIVEGWCFTKGIFRSIKAKKQKKQKRALKVFRRILDGTDCVLPDNPPKV
jgi:hypothetical protein